MALATLVLVLFFLSVLSGMLGIGVAFAAVPLLSLALPDLVNQVHPLSLALNGVTALCSMIGFAWVGLVDWRRGWLLAGVTTLASPIGALLARMAPEELLWIAYVIAAAISCTGCSIRTDFPHGTSDLRRCWLGPSRSPCCRA